MVADDIYDPESLISCIYNVQSQNLSTNFIFTKTKAIYSSPPTITIFTLSNFLKVTTQSHKMSSTSSYPQSSQHPSSSRHYASDYQLDIVTYTRSMHQHTKNQMEAATMSARRRSPCVNGINAHRTFDNQGSVSSLDSTRSS